MAHAVNDKLVQKAVADAEAKQNSFKGDAPSIKWFQIKGTKARVRIMPPWTGEGAFEGQFWRVVHQHWNVTDTLKAPILCPKKTPFMEGECAICDFVDDLRTHKDDLEAQEIVKSIRDKQAYLFSVVDVDDPEYTARDVGDFKKNFPDKKAPFSAGDPKIQVYAAPFTVYTAIINLFQSGFNLVDLNAGHNILIQKQNKGGKEFVSYTVLPEPKATKVNVPDDHPLIDLEKAGMVLNPTKVAELLSSGIGGDWAASGHTLPSAAKAKPALSSGDKLKQAKATASKEVKAALEDDSEDDEPLAYGDDSEDSDLESEMLKGLDND